MTAVCEHRVILVPQGRGLCTCEDCGAKVTFRGKVPKRRPEPTP